MSNAPTVTANPPSRGAVIDSLTSLRGFAALWVVFVHHGDLVGRFFPGFLRLRPLLDAGVMMVTVFFILSGYVLGLRYREAFRTWSPSSHLRFLALRLGRIYPVHALTLLFAVLLFARHGFQPGSPNDLGSLLANLLLVQGWGWDFRLTWNFPAWSLSSEWFAYLLFPWTARLLVGLSGRAAVVGTVLCALWSGIQAPFLNAMPLTGLADVVPSFLGGFLLSFWVRPGAASASRGVSWVADLAGLLLLVVPLTMPSGIPTTLPFILAAFVLIALLAHVGPRCGRVWRHPLAVWLGDVSYPLYLVHTLFTTVFIRLVGFDRWIHEPMPVRLAVLAAWLGGILGLAALVHHGVEIPGRRLSRRLLGAD